MKLSHRSDIPPIWPWNHRYKWSSGCPRIWPRYPLYSSFPHGEDRQFLYPWPGLWTLRHRTLKSSTVFPFSVEMRIAIVECRFRTRRDRPLQPSPTWDCSWGPRVAGHPPGMIPPHYIQIRYLRPQPSLRPHPRSRVFWRSRSKIVRPPNQVILSHREVNRSWNTRLPLSIMQHPE